MARLGSTARRGDRFDSRVPSAALSRRRRQAPSAFLPFVSAASRRQRRRDRATGSQGFDAANRRAAPGWRRRALKAYGLIRAQRSSLAEGDARQRARA